ncbi:hypothetical protein AMES_8461 [Amycolatopsis mediterranei S699]|uniref:DUF4190 domain-containing protein n=2 Tax=Amycolatopsis mediterranei TaxID=33910 RepID=A0A0H3DJB7_AMYMU|nr:hypothetical protein [Amycolatopsis mediterranei]ADJ50287.1 conserved hypothetical protein [Amycolatopsis mediterranei U32]AEK47287.1 hypothetical protein RAM_44100 [Amycolatopsis mediterranei S699]AFO81993.1 hypothetical protein AMES_8461 [Amycolatopsis mediterranei S699]AGT89122.1 hypothetical protein B737_8462 [Amycolatopsis mediterranei RB]KDO08328.1 hypothetical protein DV26_24555 [Amycolatopsis mediterranei]
MMTDPQYPPATARHGRPAPPVTATERRQANAKPARNILAIVGLLLGVAALVVTFVPDVEFVAWPLGGIGLILAITGLVQAKKGTVGDRGVAITATTVTAAALLTTGGMLLYSTFFGGGESGLHLPAVAADKHSVTFQVTSAGGATVRYGSLNDQRTENAPASTDAWQGQASYNNGSYLLTLTADTRNATVSNEIRCAILVDGKKVAENSGTTIALCTANVG